MTNSITLNALCQLRRLGLISENLDGQARAYSRHCEAAREIRRRVRERITNLERDIADRHLERAALADPETYAQQLRAARAEVDALRARLAITDADEVSIRAKWKELTTFSASNRQRLEEALAALRTTYEEVGIPWGDSTEKSENLIV